MLGWRRGCAAVTLLAAAGCTSGSPQAAPSGSTSPVSSPATPSTDEPSTDEPSTDEPSTDEPSTGGPSVGAAPVFDADRAYATVLRLAGRIGPRQATSPAFRTAARWVGARFRHLGYRVELQRLRVPAGVSWGVPVPAGTTWNVVATPRGLPPAQPYRLVGAHLDTVPQAPGAEDNASGVAVLLELARLSARTAPTLPTVFVAFGAEEPRGPTDLDHHYGSRAYVERLSPPQRRSLRGMVSLDRVGTADKVPVCTAGGPSALAAQVRRAARPVGVPVLACVNQSSDHWSFVRNGLPGVRVGGTSYAAYHSAADLPRVVDPAQLRRAGRLVWSWLSRPG